MKLQVAFMLALISRSAWSAELSKLSGLDVDMNALPRFAQEENQAIVDREHLLDFNHLDTSVLFDKKPSLDTIDEQFNLRRLTGEEYQGACANPEILYKGTTHQGKCVCDDSKDDVDRVLCILDQPDCSLGVCVEQRDIWIFQVCLDLAP